MEIRAPQLTVGQYGLARCRTEVRCKPQCATFWEISKSRATFCIGNGRFRVIFAPACPIFGELPPNGRTFLPISPNFATWRPNVRQMRPTCAPKPLISPRLALWAGFGLGGCCIFGLGNRSRLSAAPPCTHERASATFTCIAVPRPGRRGTQLEEMYCMCT